MAELDRLGSAKEIIQIGAVIGSEFSYDLLRAVHPIAEDDLQKALRNAADAELLHVRGIAPNATYLFKHALIRDAAYEALLKVRRRELHRHIAHVLSEQSPEIIDAYPELIAHHYTEAGFNGEGIRCLQKDGKKAIGRSAHAQAIRQLRPAPQIVR